MAREITARVLCTSKTVTGNNVNGAQFKFNADYQDPRNKAWAPYTPSLSVDITVANTELFVPGKSYLLTFTLDDDDDEA